MQPTLSSLTVDRRAARLPLPNPAAARRLETEFPMADHNGNREPATAEEIWNILRELSESQKETDRRMQETDRRLRKLDDLFNGQWGKLMEALVEGDLIELLGQRGIDVKRTATNLKNPGETRRWELDIVAYNGGEVVVVEVKTTLKVRDVDHLIGLLRDAEEELPEYAERRIYGAVAYLKADESSAVYAERQGLFVIRATGSSASITNGPDFTPRTFGRRSTARAVGE